MPTVLDLATAIYASDPESFVIVAIKPGNPVKAK
jgi:hypothetical protein